MNEDRCVCCNEPIPEGRQVCIGCETEIRKTKHNHSTTFDPSTGAIEDCILYDTSECTPLVAKFIEDDLKRTFKRIKRIQAKLRKERDGV